MNTNRDRIRCLSVGSMIILLKIVQICQRQKKEQTKQMQQMLDLEEDKTELKVLAAILIEDLIRTNSEETIDHLN